MIRLIAFVGFLLSGCAGIYPINIHYEDSPVPPAPDYSQSASWASHPDKKDAADSLPLSSRLVDGQQEARADVFFIYPTIFVGKPNNEYQWNASVSDSKLNEKIQATTILNQASIFNGACKVYVPYYRQAHLYTFYTHNSSDSLKALNLAYEDIRNAFQYYLDHFNHGRPIVIASHSQGSYHAVRLLREFFDGKELQKQLVMAYLIGKAIPTDYFQKIKPTEGPEEPGTWASWNTFAHGFYPGNYKRYYTKALSTNPLLWNSGESLATREMNKGGAGPGFTILPNLTDAQNHDHLLWIHKPYVKGRIFIRKKVWHRADMNLFYLNIRENVALRVDTFFKGDVSSKP
ncbi:MAG: DUF3089 domain-containing protein [Bacteroidetes bacterium]|nr:DUF3089 domain-containing protein [Bacteroidota bacterium]